MNASRGGTMILLQQAYRSADPRRQAELDEARALNDSCPAIAEVCTVEGSDRRWTFADLFAMAAERFPGRPCVVANSDISFDATLALAEPLLGPGVLVALTRWDDPTAPSMDGRTDAAAARFFSHSQDAWIFRAGSLPAFDADFQLGIPWCENRLAYEAAAGGAVILDPALSVRARHHHGTNVRTWRRGDAYRGPLYYPRLTTAERPVAEGLVLTAGWTPRAVPVTLTGDPADFAAAVAAAAARRRRIGLRGPVYLRG
jgi:hypothetical protein